MIIQDLFESPQLCPECGGISFSNLTLAEKKDACYYKVKASAKVWPSAYASGRLVQCRKKGAANYGKSKTEGVAEDFTDDVDNIYAMHPQPEKSEKIAFLILDKDEIEFATDWRELPDPYQQEFGYDLPLWDADDFGSYPNLVVKRITFDQYVNLVGNYIESEELAGSAMSKMKRGVAEGSLNEFAPSGGDGRWYTDDEIADIIGEDWFEFDLSGEAANISRHGEHAKILLVQEAQAYFEDMGYHGVVVQDVRDDEDYLSWYISGNFTRSGVAEGFPHDVDHMPGPRIKNPQTGCKRCHGKGYVYKTADGKVLPSNEQGAKRYKCGACGGIGFVKQGVAEAGPFSYGKPPRKGSVADLAAKKRKEQKRGQQPIEPKDQQVGVAKVTKGVAEEFGPLPKDNQQIRLGKYTVDIERVGLNKNYIGFAWHDSQGQEHYEEVAVGDLGSYDDLIDRIKSEIRYQERRLKQGVAEDAALAEEFDLIESTVERLAKHNDVDAELIWEDLESLSDDELYVFAVTMPLTEDWQKANKQDRTDGMSRRAVKAYRREHPGSKLKTAVTTKPSKLKRGSKASKRRKSYCSRSRGQMKMHSISCAKTPDKAICKARRRWNCE